MSRALLAALVLAGVLHAPSAAALDLLPSESRLGDERAVLLVRAEGTLVVRAEPAVRAAASEAPDAFEPTPRSFAPAGTWRGMEGIVTLHLQRDDASVGVELFLVDDGEAGAWIEWPGASVAVAGGATRETPLGGGPALLALGLAGAAFMRRGAARRACATK